MVGSHTLISLIPRNPLINLFIYRARLALPVCSLPWPVTYRWQDKRIFIKDIMHYLLPPDRLPASIAPSLQRIKRGVGTNPIANGDDSAVGTANGGSCPNGTHGADGANADRRSQAPTDKYTKPLKIVTKQPYPYGTPAEPGNPTIMPKAALAQFHFAFLIRDPHFSVPSYYRCTIPPLDDVTGFYYYDPSEAGYDELRRMFDFLRAEGQIGPHVATREDSADDIVDNRRRAVVSNGLGGSGRAGDEICVIDADDLLDKPAPMIEAFCRSVGLEFDPAMLHWDSPEDHEYVGEKFEKWRGFHNDAIESGGLEARKHVRSNYQPQHETPKGSGEQN